MRARACQSTQFSTFKLTQCAISGIIPQNEGLLLGFGLDRCGAARDFGFPSCSSEQKNRINFNFVQWNSSILHKNMGSITFMYKISLSNSVF